MTDTIYHGNNVKPTGNYNDRNGRVTVTKDPTLVTPETIIKGQLKRKAQAGVTGSRSQKHRLVIAKFERYLEQVERDTDYGNNAG